MNTAVALNAYQNIKDKVRSDEAIGHDVIGTALKKLEANLYLLFNPSNQKDSMRAYENALLAIYFLQKGLDLNNGGDLAKNLFRLYEFCRIKVIEKSISNSENNVEIKQCYSFIKEIAESWELSRSY